MSIRIAGLSKAQGNAAYSKVSEAPLGLSRYATDDPSLATDQGAAIQTWMTAIYNAYGGKGGEGIVDGSYRGDSQITVPNDGAATHSLGRSIIIKGTGYDAVASAGALGGSTLDLRWAGADAKIIALGLGLLELYHFNLADLGTSSTPFVLTTQASLNAHDMAVLGNPSKSGTTCDQDVFIFGGTTAAYDNTVASGFGGYGASVENVRFKRIRRAVYMRVWCNDVPVKLCWIDSSCGSNLVGGSAIEIDNLGVGFARSNIIEDNTIEVTNYPYGIKVTNGARNIIEGNGFWDPTGTSLADVYLATGATDNRVWHTGESGQASAAQVVEQTPGQNRIYLRGSNTQIGGKTYKAGASNGTALNLARAVSSPTAPVLQVQDETGTAKGWTIGSDLSLKCDANLGSTLPLSIVNNTAGNAAAVIRNQNKGGINVGFLAGIEYVNGGGTTQCQDTFGTGSPEGVVTGKVGSTFRRTDGGAATTQYVKESGTGNTGWVGK